MNTGGGVVQLVGCRTSCKTLVRLPMR